jgi:exosortase A-associated hydrolase 1
MRRPLSFALDGARLAATLDDGVRDTGLLIVTGGTQVRVGAHRGFAQLAAAVAERGFPVFRFDRRGIGDSEGEDRGFAASGPGMTAAAAEFRRQCPQLRRVVGFGLCDAASALALFHAEADICALLLANPWVVEPTAGLPPPAAIRRRYAERLTSRRGWSRLLDGSVNLRKAARGLLAVAAPAKTALAQRVGAALAASPAEIIFLLAAEDATAIAFASEYRKPGFGPLRASGRARIEVLPSASHSFARSDEGQWLARIVTEALERMDGG